MEPNKTQIIEIFKKMFWEKKYDGDKKHCGREGNDGPDILDCEMKCKTLSKISFGDWCPICDHCFFCI